MKISVLIDNPNSWFHKYACRLKTVLKKFDKHPSFLQNSSKLKRGDILFILSCDKILNKKKLLLHKNNIVVHAGDLPRNRGWSPLTWQVERGKNNIAITLFEAAKKLDAGSYYLKDTVRLDGTELIEEIREKQAKKTIEMIGAFLSRYPLRPIPQKGKPTYNRRRGPEDFKLNIHKSIKTQFNKMRVADNRRYPLHFVIRNKKYILKIYKDKQ